MVPGMGRLRLLLAPVFIILFLHGSVACRLVALIILISGEFACLLDGYLAKKPGNSSPTNHLLRQLADNIFHFSVFLALLQLGYAQLWMIAVIFYQESFASWLRVMAAAKDRAVRHRFGGLIKQWIQGIACFTIVALVTCQNWFSVQHLDQIIFVVMTVTTVATAYIGMEYCLGNFVVLAGDDKRS